MPVAEVILDTNLAKTLDYSVPEGMVIERGRRCEVPVRGKLQLATCVAVKEASSFSSLKAVARLGEEILPGDLLDLALWMQKYYCCNMSKVLGTMIPGAIREEMKPKEQLFVERAQTRDALLAALPELRKRAGKQAEVIEVMLKAEKGLLLSKLLEECATTKATVDALVKKDLLKLASVFLDRSPLANAEYFKTKPKVLNSEQKAALERIQESLKANSYSCQLLFGVTGSGKTEVYLQAIDTALSLGKGSLVLVPEIALTPQTIERFRARFDAKIAILHSQLSEGEKRDEWKALYEGRKHIAIGARSCVFSPVQNLGLIIVDEEHEGSYKQGDKMPCYHARDIATMRAHLLKACCVLGSATPSLESWYNAKRGKYVLSELKARAGSALLPDVRLVDMKQEYVRKGGFTLFSEPLLNGIAKRLEKGEQTLLFLNRRGYHSSQACKSCGHVVQCQHCDIALTYHKKEHRLSCHLCGFECDPPRNCSNCKADGSYAFKGYGTEQVERAICAIFPGLRATRLDADTTKHKGSQEKLLKEVKASKVDVVIGTQMIAKGHHFPDVTLVGVIQADAALSIPDFRASETAFSLFTQVAGRAGRGVLPGEVVIQTCMPDNATLKYALKSDYVAFAEEELSVREAFFYPPFAQMVKLSFTSLRQDICEKEAERLLISLKQVLPANYLFTPVQPAGHAKVKDRFRFQFTVRGPSMQQMTAAIASIYQAVPLNRACNFTCDVNPLSTY